MGQKEKEGQLHTPEMTIVRASSKFCASSTDGAGSCKERERERER
jgi:hypothetical protein